VSPSIHPDDYIFRFIFDSTPDKQQAVAEYFEKGAEAAAWLKDLIASVRGLNEPFALLDFASGYGRVTRHLTALLPACRIVGSDVHPEAVEFLCRMGIAATLSARVPEEFSPGRQFDVIFALSFFTHMPKRTWARWLRALCSCLTPGGHLIFTTHGNPGLDVMRKGLQRDDLAFDADGFWFEPTSEQKDLDAAEYGSTATSFAYVYGQLINADSRLRRFQEAGAGYQDLYIAERRADTVRRVVHSAAIIVDRVQSVLATIRHAWIETTVTNTGSDPWMNSENWIRFSLGGRIYPVLDLGADRKPLREFRALLPGSVQPGESVSIPLILDLVGIPQGEYLLQLDVVKEQHFWFADQGGTCAWLDLQVDATALSFVTSRSPPNWSVGPAGEL
jgi:SAM-dependent methyltransferase